MMEDFPPAHTAVHVIENIMDELYGCGKSVESHIERKKSSLSYVLDHKPSRREEKELEKRINEYIDEDNPIDISIIGECNMKHVRTTSQIGRFEILATSWDQRSMTFKMRYKIV